MPGDDFGTGGVGTHGAVSSSSSYASQIGLEIMQAGGNAIDAAVATMFAVGLCEPSGSGLGGGGLGVIYLADRDEYIVMDYMSQTPNNPPSSGSGGRKICIPGMLYGAVTMLNDYGTMTLAQVLNPVINLARNGFIVSEEFCYRLTFLNPYNSYTEDLFKNASGNSCQPGDLYKNEDLANTLEMIRDGGLQSFYNSSFTTTMANYIQSIGGTITKADFAQYTSMVRAPLTTNYRGYTVYTGSGTAQGGSRVRSMLNSMSGSNLSAYNRDSAQVVKLTAVAFGMRSLGSMGYKDDILNILPEDAPGYDDKTTTMLVTCDQSGNMAAMNITLGDNYGAQVAVPGTGFCFNSGMGTSTGVSLSRIQSTMSPTIVAYGNGKPMLGVGSPGDQAIITATAITISNIIDFNMNVCQAINAPRFFGNANSSAMTIESRYSASTRTALSNMGYSLSAGDAWSKGVGCVAAIHVLPDGTIHSGADIRRAYMSYAY